MLFSKTTTLIIALLFQCIAFAQMKFVANPEVKELQEKVFVMTELEKTNFELSDVVVVKYKLFVSHETAIENWKVDNKITYKDFEVRPSQPAEVKLEKEAYNGKDYRMVQIKEVHLTPNKKGELELPEFNLNLVVALASETKVSDFGRPIMNQQDVNITTDKISLMVK